MKGVQEVRELNLQMQQFFRAWNDADPHWQVDAAFVDQHDIGILTQLNAELKERLDDTHLRARFTRNVETLADLRREIMSRVSRVQPDLRELEDGATANVERLDSVFAALGL